MAKNSAYAVLGIGKGASERDIKAAYVSLVRQYDPERHTDKFMIIQAAYDKLRYVKSRAKEDVFTFNEPNGEYLYNDDDKSPAEMPTESSIQQARAAHTNSGGGDDTRRALVALLLQAACAEQQAGDLREAIKLWEEVLDIEPAHLRARHNIELASQELGHQMIAQENYTDAVRAWERALQFNPDSITLIQNIALAAEKANDPPRAGRYWGELVARWKGLLDTDEDSEYLRHCIVEALNHHGEYTEAQHLKHFTPVPAVSKADSQGEPKAAPSQVAIPKMGALDRMREVIKLRPDDMDVRMQFCNRLMEEKQFGEAVDELMKLAKKDGKRVDVLNLLGWALLNNGRKDDAFAVWKRSMTVDPKNESTREQLCRAHLLMGKSYRAKGLFTPALVHFKQLATMLPRNAEVHLELGATYDMKGDVRAAAQQYEMVLKLDPKNQVARKAINDLRLKR